MYDIEHLLEKHRKEMAELEREQRKSRQERENKLRELEHLTQEAMRLNSETSEKELQQHAV